MYERAMGSACPRKIAGAKKRQSGPKMHETILYNMLNPKKCTSPFNINVDLSKLMVGTRDEIKIRLLP